MELTNYNIRAAAFKAKKAANYELSILTGVDSFAYVVRDRSRNRLLAYHSSPLDVTARGDLASWVRQHTEADQLLNGVAYGSILLGWATERFTLVPHELYQPEHRGDYLGQLTSLHPRDGVREEFHNDLDAHLLYLADTELQQRTADQLRATRIQHAAGGLLNTWASRSRRLGQASVSACLRGNRVLVAAHRSGTLQYFNTFEYDTPEDVLYYALLAYDQAGLLPNRTSLYLCGEVNRPGAVFDLLYTYVQDIHFCKYGAPPSLPADVENLPAHLYFDLLCLG